jgi:serine/threonine protein kinase
MGSLHDAYELGGVAGHGRTTIVRLGVRRGDASPVALKQLRIEHAQDPDKRARFIQQARRACMLHHEGIETMLDVVDGRDGPVAVAEWIDGRSLERLALGRRRNDQPWSPEEVALVARGLLEALRYAHHQPTAFDTHGMLHGGLWPGNVLVDVAGNVKLVDFGMASVWQEAREPWQDLESLRYLSSDHVRHGATAASDLYAVGAIVHELLAGHRFRSELQTEAEMRAAIDRLEPPERPREDEPIQLERLRRRLLEPVQNPRLTIEHVLDLCAAIPLGDARDALRALVRETLRNDSTAPEPDTPPLGITLPTGPEIPHDGVAKSRFRDAAAIHLAAGNGGLGIALRQVPLGQTPRPPRRRDTQSVPVPVHHEQTAARQPMFLQQTAPPVGEEARSAERERSGGGGAAAPQEVLEVDTAPLPVGEPEAAVPEPIDEPDDHPEPLVELEVTAEISGIPRLPEDVTPLLPIATAPPARSPGWLRGPLGWALLGAVAVGVGLPLWARCSAADGAPAVRTTQR